ncbi:tetratricopeptide repeat protein [Calothrix sp. CCY 0018]|uniref:tetratricopeptide repeat protein n=1 Tax=Calothrix sp. CCY 0018 TaxID=3103864 RepID=UPI0039C69169
MNYKKIISLTLTIATLTTINTIVPQVKTQANQPQNKQTITQTKASDWYYKGIIKVNKKDCQGAIEDFTKAIEINPRYASAYYQRGLIYGKYAQGKILRPDGTLPGCVRVNEYSISCDVKVTANWKQQNQQQAIKDFNRVISITPRYAAAYHQRGLIQENRRDKLKDFQFAALTYLKFNNYSEAANVLEDIDQLYLEENPDAGMIERPTGSPGLSAELKKSPHELMNEAREALNKSDVKTALEKYKLAAQIFKERKNTKKHQEVQQIISKLEKKVK